MIQRYYFDRTKPFYPFVIAYLTQLHGLKVTLCFRSGQTSPPTVPQPEPNQQLLAPLMLKVRGDSRELEVKIEQLADELNGNLEYLASIYVQAAQTMLSGAYEAFVHVGHNSKAAEFLRHARNAAAHNGCWHFTKDEPRRVAEWRGLTLSKADQGLPLLSLPSTPGALELGDLVALLWDIEQECAGAPFSALCRSKPLSTTSR